MTALLSPSQSVPTHDATASKTSDKNRPAEGAASPPTFDALPLSHDVRTTLAEMGYVHPTPVQLAVFEPAKRGKDLVVQARTGTGKTAAFGLPIVDHIVKRSVDRVQVLALCPTRELALQVAAELERLGKRRGVRVTSIYGGAPMQRQIDAIAAGAQVICGTPGRVLDHLRRGTLDPRSIRLVVLDESDEMLSMGFERELNAILEYLPPDRQTLLFSATLPPDIERIAKNKLRSPEFVTLSGDHVGALEILHFVYMVSTDKITAFLRLIEVENPESAIVFCNTRDETERLAGALQRQGFEADWLNGDLDQGEREKVMAATREGRLRFLVATDVAARGIDISHLTHVINFDFPQDAESYVHRTGRTGRAGRTGTAISLVTPHDIGQLYLLRLTYKIRPIEKQIPTESEIKTRAEADLVAMFAEAYGKKSVHPDDLSLARRLLTHDSSEVILAGLLRDHLGARPTAREEASANRRAQKPRPAPPPAQEKPAPAAAVASSTAPQPERFSAPQPERHTAPQPERFSAPQPERHTAPQPERHTAPRPDRFAAGSAVAGPAVALTAPVPRDPHGANDTVEVPHILRSDDTVAEAAVARAALASAGPIPVVEVAASAGPASSDVTAPMPVVPSLTLPSPAPARDSAEAARSLAESAALDATAPLAAVDISAPATEISVPSAVADTSPTGVEPRGGFGGPRPQGERYGRRDERRDDRGRRGRDRDRGGGPRSAEFGENMRDRAAAPRPLDRARPVGAAGEGAPKEFVRHSDFTTWQPPEEEGDDEPIWGGDSRRPAGAFPGHAAPAEAVASEAAGDAARSADPQWGLRPDKPSAALPPGELVELHVTVGRRDGARASDLVRVLEKAGLTKDSVQRVRVRERHAFLTVRKEDEERAIAALNGVVIAGRTAAASRARERAADAGAAEPNGGDEPTS